MYENIIHLRPLDTAKANLVSLSGGRYVYNYKTMDSFFEGLSKLNFFDLAEIPWSKGYSRLVVDIDIEKHTTELEPLHSLKDIELVYTGYFNVLKKYIPIEKLDCFVLTKNPYIKDGQICKHGFHLHFIDVFLMIEDKVFIREEAQKNITFEIDAIESNPWLLYGSQKNRHSGKYEISGLFQNGKYSDCFQHRINKNINIIRWMSILPSAVSDKIEVFDIPKSRKVYNNTNCRSNIDITFDPDTEEQITSFLERKNLSENYSIKPDGRIARLSPCECLVNPSVEHDSDNSYWFRKNGNIYIGCYRKCKDQFGSQIVCISKCNQEKSTSSEDEEEKFIAIMNQKKSRRRKN